MNYDFKKILCLHIISVCQILPSQRFILFVCVSRCVCVFFVLSYTPSGYKLCTMPVLISLFKSSRLSAPIFSLCFLVLRLLLYILITSHFVASLSFSSVIICDFSKFLSAVRMNNIIIIIMSRRLRGYP